MLPFLLKFDHLHFAVILQHQKVEMIKIYECVNIQVISVQNLLIGSKTCLYFVGILDFFLQIDCSDCRKIILSNFSCSSSSICPALALVKRGTSEMSFKSSNEPINPISEKETGCGNNYRLIKKTRNEGDQKLCVVLIRRTSEGAVSYILSMKWLSCYSEVRYHNIYQEQVQITPFQHYLTSQINDIIIQFCEDVFQWRSSKKFKVKKI